MAFWRTFKSQVSWTKLSLGEIKQRSFPSSPGVFNKIPINKLDTKPLHFNLKHQLPFSIRVLLESTVRNCDNFQVTENYVQNILKCKTNQTIEGGVEVVFKPARVILQDFTRVPAVVDFTTMRDAVKILDQINPVCPSDLVIDHSIQADFVREADAHQKNENLKFERNKERFTFLKRGAKAFKNMLIVPGSGIVHQVNLECLARVFFTDKDILYPDSLVGTDSHTTMINGLGVLGWAVRGIEAEAVMLGQAISMLLPQVLGYQLTGTLNQFATSTDLVLTITQGVRPYHRTYAQASTGCKQKNPKGTEKPPNKLKNQIKMILYVAFATFLLVYLAIGLQKQTAVTSDKDVLVLTKDNFQSIISSSEYLLVEFYTSWCFHCKQLAPEYANAAQHLAQTESSVKLGKVDATIERELAEQFGIKRYPTLKFFENGKPIDYTGGRTKDDIIQWVLKKSGPAEKVLQSEEELKSFIEEKHVAIVGFFENLESDAAKLFLELADFVTDHPFGLVSDYSKFSDLEHKDTFVLYKDFGEKKVVLDQDISNFEDFKRFIFAHSLPSVIEFNLDTIPKMIHSPIKSHLLLFLSKKEGHFDKLIGDIKPVALKFKGKILFITIDVDKKECQLLLELFGLKQNEVPSMIAIKLENKMTKFKSESPELIGENVKKFVSDFIEGKVKQYLPCEELPEDWNKTPVWTLTGTNFDSVALDSTKDVLVEFYAPWCEHCKQLAPIFDKVGEYFSDKDDIIIAKLNATLNEFKHNKISSFPTLLYYPKGDNPKAIVYNGDRTLEAIIKFIKADGKQDSPSSASGEEGEKEDEEECEKPKDEL